MLTLIRNSLVHLQGQRRREPRSVMIMLGLIFGLLLLTNGSPLSMAQSTGSATLRGMVKDPAGAVVNSATVVLINEATKIERKAVSNQEGSFVFSAVSPATYTIKIESTGFKKLEQNGLVLSPNDVRGLEFVLEIGAPSETVTVTAATETLQTETGAKENTITSKQIENLSIIGRSSLELLRILPGVVAPNGDALQQVGFGSGSNANNSYNVNGLRGENNTVTVDGARMMDIGANNGTIITANPDMVQEVKVQTSNYAAEHGTSSIMINAITKGGSSAFHGSLYDYSRDYRLGANDRSNTGPPTGPIIKRPKSQYNYPGGNIGGPLYLPKKVFGPLGGFNENKDKLFFFAGFEYYYQKVDEGSVTPTGGVPTMKMRQGDFSELLALPPSQRVQLRVPAGCTALGWIPGMEDAARPNVPNNDLRPCIDQTGLGPALLNFYPAPNVNVPVGSPNYTYSVLRPNIRNQFTSRFDYNLSEKTKLYVRLAREYEEQGFPRGLWWNSSSYEIPGNLSSDNLGRSVVVNLTNIISPSMTNEVLFGASKLKLNYDFKDPDKVSYEALGVQKSTFFPNSNPYLPIGIVTWGAGDFTTAYGFPILAWNDTFSVTDNVTKVHNSHTVKFGAFIEQANKRQQSNSDTNFEMASWAAKMGTGNVFGDLFTGRPGNVTAGTDRPLDNFRYYNYEFYAQDSWKVKSNFTLEYGVRVAYLPNNFERKGLGTLFDPRTYDRNQGLFLNGNFSTPNGILTAAAGQIPKGVLENNAPAIMPRLNFAWDIGGKGDLVIRAGAGIFYNRVQGNYDYYSSGVMPNTYRATMNSSSTATGLTFAGLSALNPFSSISAVDILSRDINSNDLPQVINSSLTIEKRLPANNIFTIAYVGTQGRHLPQTKQINFVQPGTMFSGIVMPTPEQVASQEGGSACSQPASPECQQLIARRTVNLSDPIHRVALEDAASRLFRPFSAYDSIGVYQFTGTSSYHSLQATLSRQTGKLTYFATYTFGKAMGTTAVNETDGAAWADPIDTRGRSWGVLPFDRTHIFNLSYNYYFPNIARGFMDKPIFRGIFNGWQTSGITTFQSGTPVRIRFAPSGEMGLGSNDVARAFFGTDAYNINGNNNVGGITPIFLKDPSRKNDVKIGEKILDINALALPGFGDTGPGQPPFYVRYPGRSNFDISFFKNFKISEAKSFQFRAGFFNIFNQAYPNMIDLNNPSMSDINLTLNTRCNRTVPAGTPNGVGGTAGEICDPQGGFSFTPESIENFGTITTKRGRRIVELALKFYF
jgi:Carboxypeptidase regulatory-like domain/TonB-dependent Receptor Plug Domain